MSNDNDFLNSHIMIIGVGAPAPFGAKDMLDVMAGKPGAIGRKTTAADYEPGGALHETRPLWRIAQDIDAEWVDKDGKPNVWYGAVPYLVAMRDLDKITDRYGMDPAKDIVVYFISNASAWKGERATEIKNELRRLAGLKEVKPAKKKSS